MGLTSKYLGLLLCFAAFGLSSADCHRQPLQLKGHNRYLPLASGNEWYFHSQRSPTAIFKFRTADYVYLEGETFVAWEDIVEDSTSPGAKFVGWRRCYLRYGDNGEILELPDYQWGDRAKLFPMGLRAAIGPRYKTEARVGESWEMYEILPTGAAIGKVRVTLLSRDDSVSLPAGILRHCLRFRFDKEDSPFNTEEFSHEEWLAPGIGLVRRQGVVDRKVDSLRSYTLH